MIEKIVSDLIGRRVRVERRYEASPRQGYLWSRVDEPEGVVRALWVGLNGVHMLLQVEGGILEETSLSYDRRFVVIPEEKHDRSA